MAGAGECLLLILRVPLARFPDSIWNMSGSPIKARSPANVGLADMTKTFNDLVYAVSLFSVFPTGPFSHFKNAEAVFENH
jgi:hypothetical protein